MDLECDSHKCVVEWLAGNRVAYTDPLRLRQTGLMEMWL